MGVTISHYDGLPSATTIANLGIQLAHVTTSSEWRRLAPLFDGRLGAPVAVPPQEAARIGDLLQSAAGHRLMAANWADLARRIGAAAHRAAASGKHWEWS